MSSGAYWWRRGGQDLPRFPALDGDLTAEVCVVGGGITGLTAALRLARGGLDVVLVEAGRLGSGTTGSTSAHLTVVPDTPLPRLVAIAGKDAAHTLVRAGRTGLDRIEQLDAELSGRGRFRSVPGWLWARDERDLERAHDIAVELVACGERAVFPVEVPLPGRPFGMRIDGQGRFSPVAWLAGVAELARDAGVRIFEGTGIDRWTSGEVGTAAGVVRAPQIVLATHSPPGFVPSVQTRLAPRMSYLLVARGGSEIPDGLYWDLAQPYHYIRTLEDGRLLIGGADQAPGAGLPAEQLRALEDWAVTCLGIAAVEDHWDAELFEPSDGLPYVGHLPNDPATWVATGLSGTGLTLGVWAAEHIASCILGEATDERHPFSPRRVTLLGSAAAEGVKTAVHLVVDRVRSTGDRQPADLSPGEGQLMTVSGRKVAVWRDDDGVLHLLSPVCRHLGCIVQWNALDRTWDCPCHGGRYTAEGRRLYGPPLRDLESVGLEDDDPTEEVRPPIH